MISLTIMSFFKKINVNFVKKIICVEPIQQIKYEQKGKFYRHRF